MNTQEENKLNMKGNILEKINSGNIDMRPKFIFTLKVAALLGLTFLILVVSVFILTFISFSVRINHHEALLGFGPRGIINFFYLFPWLLFILDIVLILFLEACLRKFRFGYKFPVLYLFLVLLMVTGIFGLSLDRGTSFNDSILERRERLPRPVGSFYGGAHRPPKPGQGMCFCKLVTINGKKELIVEDNRGEGPKLLVVELPPNLADEIINNLKIGDMLLVAGKESNGVIQAFGIQKIVPRIQ